MLSDLKTSKSKKVHHFYLEFLDIAETALGSFLLLANISG